ncbi:hypothetical protein ACHAW5_008306 [Stephanodiscus triporus]|uniref:Uncharacterized protein n=1 Tax=Stephanodiscus triporus TaxID=2934178 RepID=A0ABD3NQW3_9STRA
MVKIILRNIGYCVCLHRRTHHHPPTALQNSFYDATGGADSVAAKVECVRKLMHEQVERGQMTRRELDRLLRQVEERIASLGRGHRLGVAERGEGCREADVAEGEGGSAEADARGSRGPAVPHAEARGARITALRAQLRPLLKLEQSTRGKLLSIKKTKELAAKDGLLEEISDLERVGGTKNPGTGSRSAGDVAWLTPGGLAAKQTALGKKASAASKSKPKSGDGVFAAMMIGSDSDSD